GIADLVLNRQPLGFGLSAGGIEQVAGDVNADYLCAAARDHTRGPAGSCGQIKNSLAGLRIQPQHAVLDGIGDAAADLVILLASRTPDRRRALVVLLDLAAHRGCHKYSFNIYYAKKKRRQDRLRSPAYARLPHPNFYAHPGMNAALKEVLTLGQSCDLQLA